MPTQTNNHRPRKAAYSVAETAALCGVSRSRFYDFMESGVMPPPIYCLRSRRPYYPADLAALCVRIRETSIGFDGQFVLFYDRKPTPVAAPPTEMPQNARKATALDPLTKEMVETLRAMGVRASDGDVLAAVTRRCPSGVTEASFETDLRAVFDALRCREAV